jgi:hypothetical protein
MTSYLVSQEIKRQNELQIASNKAEIISKNKTHWRNIDHENMQGRVAVK